MNEFEISSQDCHLLSALQESSSLREAARKLNCDPSSIVRRAQRLSQEKELLYKVEGKWVLTKKGLALHQWAKASIIAQRDVLNTQLPLSIGSTMWLCEQIIIPNLTRLKMQNPAIGAVQISTPTGSFENALFKDNLDFIIACHPPENPSIKHKRCIHEKWVTIVPFSWRSRVPTEKNAIFDFLNQRTYIRHNQLNPETIYPKGIQVPKSQSITIDHLTGVRSAVSCGLGWSCVPKILVQSAIKNKEVCVVEIPVSMKNELCLWWPRERKDLSSLADQTYRWLKDSSK